LFRSHHFAIENRPELGDQSIEQVMHSLNELGAPDVQLSRQDSGGTNAHRRLELTKWLSDWHLLAFLGTCGLLSEVTNIPLLPLSIVFPIYLLYECFTPNFHSSQADSKVLIRVATSPNMENDPAVLDALLETESWQTLATFARESARMSLFFTSFMLPHDSIAIVLNVCSFNHSTTSCSTRARRTANSYHGR